MSFPNRQSGNPYWIKANDRWIIMLFSILVFANIVLSLNSCEAESMEAEVEVRLDQHYVVHTIGPNSSDTIYISGNVSCKFDGWGSSVQTIEVLVLASNELDWSTSAGPDPITFHENGIKSIFVTIPIPINTYNNTVNTITVWGTWHTEPHEKEPLGANGEVKTDSLSITVYREWYLGAPTTSTPEYEPYTTWWEDLGNEKRMIVTFSTINLFLVIILILVYKIRKKRIKKLLKDMDSN